MSETSTKLAKGQISVGGKIFTPKYRFQTFVDMHEQHGVNVFDLNTTPKTIAVIVWGAIRDQAPTITPEEVSKQLTIDEAVKANRVCTRVLVDSLPKREPDDEAEKSA